MLALSGFQPYLRCCVGCSRVWKFGSFCLQAAHGSVVHGATGSVPETQAQGKLSVPLLTTLLSPGSCSFSCAIQQQRCPQWLCTGTLTIYLWGACWRARGTCPKATLTVSLPDALQIGTVECSLEIGLEDQHGGASHRFPVLFQLSQNLSMVCK